MVCLLLLVLLPCCRLLLLLLLPLLRWPQLLPRCVCWQVRLLLLLWAWCPRQWHV